MTMRGWVDRLDDFLKASGRRLLDHAGTISTETAKAKAEAEYERYRATRDRRGLREGRQAAQGVAAATAPEAAEGEVVTTAERMDAPNHASEIGPSFPPRFLPCPRSPRREPHASLVARVAEASTMFTTSRRRSVDKMKKYGLQPKR